MSIANAKNGSVIEPRAVQAATPQVPARHPTAGSHQDQGLLLAQIPNLDPITTPDVSGKRVEGRIISQALSIKLVFGVGIGLLVGAILFGKASRPSPTVTELPAWSSNGGSARIAENTSQTRAPTWPSSPASAVAAVPPQTPPAPAPAVLLPQPPQVGDVRPTALTEPSWLPPRPAVASATTVTPSPAPSNYVDPPITNTNLPDNRTGYRGFDHPLDPRTLQADNRNDAAAQYRNNDVRYDYRGNAIDASAIRRDLPAGGYSRDPRYDTGSTYPPATSPGSPLMPSGVQGPLSTYRDPQPPEPGVARFDGTIATPPVRTSYDRAGSNTN